MRGTSKYRVRLRHARFEAAGLMHLPVFQSARGAVQAPLGDVAPGRGPGPVAVAAGVSGAPGHREPAPLVDGWAAGDEERVGRLTGQPPRPEHSDLGMGMIDLRPSRPAGPGGPGARGPSPGARTGAFVATRRASLGAGASGAPRLETTAPGPEAGPRASSLHRDMARAQAQRGPRPSTAMPSGCWSMCSTSPPHWHKTKWSSTWPAASARRPASGGRYGPGITPRTPLTSSTTPKTA